MNSPASLPAQPFNETRQRILDSAVQCVKQWGIDKTSLGDIAKTAGVTRPTVYSYFPGKDDVIRAALLQSGHAFSARVIRHIKKFKTTGDRAIEALMFALEQLPREPYLTVITQADLATRVNDDALSDQEGRIICYSIFREIFKDETISDDQLFECVEFTVRLLLSLLMIKGPVSRSAKETRAFLRRRLLPALGLTPAR